jgi:hypothetical protein
MAIEHPNLVTTLPQGLNTLELLPKVRKGVSQWSRVTAWLWTDCLAYADAPEKAKLEQDLKSFLINTLKSQAQHADAFVAYGDPSSKLSANTLSKTLRNLLLGKNGEIPNLPPGIDFTLSDVIEKLTGEALITVTDPPFGEMFLFQVTTNSFSGTVEQAKDEKGQDIPNKYVLSLAFPPRPELGELTVTEQQLYDWANKPNPGGNYLPPSPYIPIAGT